MAESTIALELLQDGRYPLLTIGDTVMTNNTKGLPGAFLLSNGVTYRKGHAYAITANSGAPYLVAIAPSNSVDQSTLVAGVLEDDGNMDGLDTIVGDGSTTYVHLVVGVLGFKITATSGGVITQDHVGKDAYFEFGDLVTINPIVGGGTAASAPKAGKITKVDTTRGIAWVDMRPNF